MNQEEFAGSSGQSIEKSPWDRTASRQYGGARRPKEETRRVGPSLGRWGFFPSADCKRESGSPAWCERSQGDSRRQRFSGWETMSSIRILENRTKNWINFIFESLFNKPPWVIASAIRGDPIFFWFPLQISRIAKKPVTETWRVASSAARPPSDGMDGGPRRTRRHPTF